MGQLLQPRPAEHLAAVALGSNLGDRAATIDSAFAALAALPRTALLARSAVVETTPVGSVGQGPYLNAAAVLSTALSPRELLDGLLTIERQHARTRVPGERWGPRTLDLDLLLYDDRIIREPGLEVPHPRMHERAFVLDPLNEIAHDWTVPGIGETVGELWIRVHSGPDLAHERPAAAEARASRTAMITCLMRALHSKYDRPALIHDTWADHFITEDERREMADRLLAMVGPDEREYLRARGSVEAILHTAWRTLPVYASVVMRTRYAEDRVEALAAMGFRQYVIIGAGLDSFGVRRPGFARDVQVFEVDHAASQVFKRERLAASGATIPSTLHFVQADLGKEDLGTALERSAFKFDEPAIMSWLGVTMYLTREANLATLRSISNFAAPGSELVFTYVEQRALESDSPFMLKARAFAAAMGEPWLSGFDPFKLEHELHELGLARIEDLNGEDMQRRYAADGTDGLNPGKAGRIALARVIGPPEADRGIPA